MSKGRQQSTHIVESASSVRLLLLVGMPATRFWTSWSGIALDVVDLANEQVDLLLESGIDRSL